MPSVSVVIACRNAADTLGIQLEALSRQQYDGEWDVIISDNGSTDHTRIVAQRYMSVLPGLQIVDSSDRAAPGTPAMSPPTSPPPTSWRSATPTTRWPKTG